MFLCLLWEDAYAEAEAIRSVRSINSDWKFILRDEQQAFKSDYNDSSWRTLDVPHDWAFENGYSKDGAQRENGGYAMGGIGWYRKTFELSEQECNGHSLYIDFEGVYMNSEVWVNEHYMGKRPYGYISFGYDVTPYVKPGKNFISVRVDNSHEPSARWYHGCGIYGNVTLSVLPVSHFSKWGTFVYSTSADKDMALMNISSEVEVRTNNPLFIEYTIESPERKVVYKSGKLSLDANILTNNGVEIKTPVLWDIDNPRMYTLTSRLFENERIIDETIESFGIRNIKWNPETGFWLNGKNVKIQGVCEHMDGGATGAVLTENLLRWKIKLLKDMGCNAIRGTHNPQLPAFYKVCDEMGMLVLDEVFDGWKKKAAEDYGKQAFKEWWERDLRDFIKRDRNHPSVIAYSLGNETNGPVGKDMVRVCHELDSNRLATSGHSGSEYMDIFGVNGNSEKKSFFETYKPGDKAFIGTENPHTWQVRGYYRTHTWYRDGYSVAKGVYEIPNLTDKELFHYEWAPATEWTNGKQHFNSSYDNSTVRINVRRSIENLRDIPWYSASFRWTGFDYKGEAGYVHGGWPFRAFMGGVLDLAGFKKDHYYLYQSEWGKVPVVHILPHWTHPNMKKGEKIPVWVYTSGDSVELFFNGKSLGRKSKGAKWNEMQCEWLVPWKEGELLAVAYENGVEICRTRQVTVPAPKALKLEVQDACLTGSPEDFHIIDISQVGEEGDLYPYGENRVYWTLVGDGEIFSAENGNPVDVENNWRAESKNAFFGLLRLFVKDKKQKGLSLYAASILGDKRLKMDNRVAIDVKGIDLKGKSLNVSSFKILYTTDGSDPVSSGKLYKKPFRMKTAGTVKAVVVINDTDSLILEEKFGPEEGLYWGSPEDMVNLLEIQAENCTVKNGNYSTKVKGYQSSGYIETKSNPTTIEFYQENDGPDMQTELIYRFVPTKECKVSVNVSNNGKTTSDEFEVKGDEVGKWNERTVKTYLNRGANNISVVINTTSKLGLDGFSFK